MRQRYSFSSRHTGNIENIKKKKEKYPELLKKIIDESDIILEVLDARFPEETRNYEVENEIRKKNKVIIYVINKSDLIKNEAQFNKNLYPKILVSCKNKKKIGKLRNLIKQITKKMRNEKGKTVAGVIGYPNTGKSSLINSLIGKSSAGTGAEAGFTKGLQKIKLSKEIILLDSPGVIPQKEYSPHQKEKISKHAKIGGRSFSQVKEPDIIVASLMREYPQTLEKFYDIDAEGDSEIFIERLGRKKGFLKKGGLVDEDRTARAILKDWQEGRIRV